MIKVIVYEVVPELFHAVHNCFVDYIIEIRNRKISVIFMSLLAIVRKAHRG